MKSVSIQDLKAHLSELIAEASVGATIVITRHGRPVATLVPAGRRDVHAGARFGKTRLKSLLKNATRGKYLDVLADDRRGGARNRA
jgi:prevent-host-death family protein